VKPKQRQVHVSVLDLAQIRLGEAGNLGKRLLLDLPFLTQPGEIEANQPTNVHTSFSGMWKRKFIRYSEYGIILLGDLEWTDVPA